MIIAIAFLLFAVNSVIFVVTGDWLNGISALAFAIAWGALSIRAASRKADRLIQENTPREGAEGSLYTTPGARHCRCAWLGVGTPEHDASSLCISLRPDADRDEEKS